MEQIPLSFYVQAHFYIHWKSPLNGIPFLCKSPQWFHGLAKELFDKVENRGVGEISVLAELFLAVVIQCCSSAPLRYLQSLLHAVWFHRHRN